MEHLAILSKKLKLLDKIISGEKKIESRWYKFKKTPYQNISIEEFIYFKEAGDPVRFRARVDKVLFFENLNEDKIKEILSKYNHEICAPLSYAEEIKDKKFCTLIFIKEIEKIEPFNIDKKGFGLMSAWISLENIKQIKK